VAGWVIVASPSSCLSWEDAVPCVEQDRHYIATGERHPSGGLRPPAATIAALNERFLDKEGPTDVLSFRSEIPPRQRNTGAGYAGDIAISADIARQNGRLLGHGAAIEIKTSEKMSCRETTPKIDLHPRSKKEPPRDPSQESSP